MLSNGWLLGVSPVVEVPSSKEVHCAPHATNDTAACFYLAFEITQWLYICPGTSPGRLTQHIRAPFSLPSTCFLGAINWISPKIQPRRNLLKSAKYLFSVNHFCEVLTHNQCPSLSLFPRTTTPCLNPFHRTPQLRQNERGRSHRMSLLM